MYIPRKTMIQRLGLTETELTNKELCQMLNDTVHIQSYIYNEKHNTVHESIYAHNKVDLKSFGDKKRGIKVLPRICPACGQEKEHKLFLKVDRSVCKYCLECRKKGIK